MKNTKTSPSATNNVARYFTSPIVYCLGLVLLSSGEILSAATLQQPLFEFKFEQLGPEGAQAKDTGTVGRDQRMVTNINSWAMGDARTAGGLGVSGQITDRALDSRNATSMGSALDGSGVLIYPADTKGPEIDQLASFTISGWYQAENAPLGGSARLFKFQNGSAGFDA